jgi:hypothetical protein
VIPRRREIVGCVRKWLWVVGDGGAGEAAGLVSVMLSWCCLCGLERGGLA